MALFDFDLLEQAEASSEIGDDLASAKLHFDEPLIVRETLILEAYLSSGDPTTPVLPARGAEGQDRTRIDENEDEGENEGAKAVEEPESTSPRTTTSPDQSDLSQDSSQSDEARVGFAAVTAAPAAPKAPAALESAADNAAAATVAGVPILDDEAEGLQILAESLDLLSEVRWNAVVTEPSPGTLVRWSNNDFVREVLRQFVLEDMIGEADLMRFTDLYRLFDSLGYTLGSIVAKFSEQVPTEKQELNNLMERIFVRFASTGLGLGPGGQSLRFRDLFRMFEVLGINMYKLLSKFVDDSSTIHSLLEGSTAPKHVWRFGNFLVSREIGAGFRGPCCYLAEHALTRQKAAVKWPVSHFELTILQEVHKKALMQPGLPRVLACGYFDGQCYVVSELLGSTLSKVFARLLDHSLDHRWAALRVIGRLLLRRLKALHGIGYVHNDVSPENVLLGRSRLTPGASSRSTLYLVDFGLTRRAGTQLQGCEGSAEWSSVRAADGGPRLPHDDVEALGWVLVYGLFGELPWCERLAEAYQVWHSPSCRMDALRDVQESKLQLLQGGWDSHLGHWRQLADVPEELKLFMKRSYRSNSDEAIARPPDYAFLLGLLGDSAVGSSCMEAEERDLLSYAEHVAPLL
mmetsp:Transcript_37534/g.81519  ORF Transcript_37534/g.81519 Transcript_37534/m.81519 type:complete len:632 (+) Transcript_37534:80-1975(+)